MNDSGEYLWELRERSSECDNRDQEGKSVRGLGKRLKIEED